MIKAIYIHIPFCSNICSYCDFPKIYYQKEYINRYLDSLKKEIKDNYCGEIIDTIYIGGGTPSSLSILELTKLFNIIKIFRVSNNLEFTIECNIENVDEDKLKLMYKNGVNRLSFGVQTFNDNLLKKLNRKHNKCDVFSKTKLAKQIGFKNINIDLMYALPGETLEDLEEDLNNFFKLDISHISCYSLIIEPHTKLYNDNVEYIDEDKDYQMYELINNRLKNKGYKHYEISNYAKDNFQSKHNLTYWNNNTYYGFGMGASGYIDNTRYTNTFNIDEYIKNNHRKEIIELDYNNKVENEFILGLRKIKGINKQNFYNKYKFNINEIEELKELIKDDKLIDDGINVKINDKYIYTSNSILMEFLDVNYESYKR